MWTEQSSSTFLVVIAASIAAHVAMLAILPPADATATVAPRTNTVVMIETPAKPTEPPPAPKLEELVPESAPEKTAARAPAPRTSRTTPRRSAPPPRVAAAEPPPSNTPVDFSGVTLSNEGASWSSPVGDGSAITQPIGSPQPTTRIAATREIGAAAGDRIVAVGDLSRPPKAPNLDASLASNYPSEARRAGTTGNATVRARILADGSVGAIRVMSESAPGFGVACKRTLAGSRWQAPLDSRSQPVITDISYTCTFAVAR